MNYIKIYSNFLKKFLNSRKPLKVIFDCSNGTTGLVLKKIFSKYKLLTTYYLNDNPDGNFPAHGPNPSAKNAINQIKKEVLRQKADLGAIFDADGDRIFFVDNLGHLIDPDVIARLLIWRLNPKKVVIDVRAGWLIKNLKSQISQPKEENLKIIESKIGHYFIKKLMRKINADFGAERSGHYYFPAQNGKKFYFDSGILAAIEIINAISELPYSLADFNDLLPQYYRSEEINIKSQISNLKSQKLLFKKIENYFKLQTTNYKLLTTNHLDGLTMEFNPSAGSGQAWWFNLRPSNTESLLRLNIEAINKKIFNSSLKKIISLIKK